MKTKKKVAIFLNIGIGDFIWGTSVIPIIKSFDKNIEIILFTRKITACLINKNDVYKIIKFNPGRFKTKHKIKRFFYKCFFVISKFFLLYKIDSVIFFDDITFVPEIAKSIFKIKHIYGPDIRCFGYDLKNNDSVYYTNIIKMPKNMDLFHCMMRYQFITRSIFPVYNLSLPKLKDTSYMFPRVKKYIQTNKNYKIMICTKGSSVWRYWPTDYFIKLIEMINIRYDATFFIIGNSKEQFDTAMKIIKKHPSIDIRNLCNKTSLLELKEMFKYMNLLISVDSAAVHFAAIYNIPTVSFHGQTLPERSRPVNYNSIAMCSYRDCSPCDVDCFINGKFCRKPECMYDLTPEKVFENIEKLLV